MDPGALAAIANSAVDLTKFYVKTGLDVLGFQTKAEKQAFELKKNEQRFQQDLNSLSNEQGFVLQQNLNQAKDDTERYSILTNAVLQLKLQKQGSSSKANSNNTILILGALTLLVIVLIFTRKKSN